MRRPSRRATLAIVLLVSALTAPAVAGAAPTPALTWKSCTTAAQRGFQCATLRVPLDYGHPDGRTIRLAVIRHRATDRQHRIGTLFFNFGGPGAAGAELLPHAPISAALRARFDIASWDPRGVGQSTAVRCFASPQAERVFFGDLIVSVSFPVGIAQMFAWRARYRELYARCNRRSGDLLRHVSTADTARDLDLLRRAAGDRRLSYAGFSYGTLVGVTYANLFPGRVRALMLDANLDPEAYSKRELEANGGRFLSTDLRLGSDLASASTLNAFLDLCGSADVAHCAFTAGDADATRAKYAALLARVQAQPGTANLTYAQVVSMTANGLYSVASWPSLATVLQGLWTTGDAPAPETLPEQGLGPIYAIRCSESPNPGPTAFPGLDAFSVQRAGPIGPYWSWTSAACATWGATAADPYRGPWDRRTAHPVLVVNNTFDPASPYRDAVAMTRELARARLLTVDGYGHIVGNRSSCATRAIDRYLVDLRLPRVATRCRQDREPFARPASS
jgi:pimeloyl-ACP methyl ester carboxylesterase